MVTDATRFAVFLVGWLAPIYAGAWAADMPSRKTTRRH